MAVDRGPFLQTFSGRRWYPLSPDSKDVCLEDLAHHLSMRPRWGGATVQPYNVADHSIRVADVVISFASHLDASIVYKFALRALLHDAHEAYTGDHATPIKAHDSYEAIRRIEADAQDAIDAWSCVLLSSDQKEQCDYYVKHADAIVLATERRDLLLHMDWGYELPGTPLPTRIVPRSFKESKEAFKHLFSLWKGDFGADNF